MYLGVDVGGTKTLVAVIDDNANIIEQTKFPTSQNYQEFLGHLATTIKALETKKYVAGSIAVPGHIDRDNGVGVRFPNLDWANVPVRRDAEKIAHCPMALENDAKLAGLSESMLRKDKYRRVLYVTISTGIGIALIVDGVIDKYLGDGGGNSIMIEHQGKVRSWESFASGRAIVRRYGKKAVDITDNETWEAIGKDLALGFAEVIGLTEPDVVVVGGSVGNYFERVKNFVVKDLENFHLKMTTLPTFEKAQRPEEAVIFGCYDLAKQTFGHAVADN